MTPSVEVQSVQSDLSGKKERGVYFPADVSFDSRMKQCSLEVL